MIPMSDHPNKDRVAQTEIALAKLESIEAEIQNVIGNKIPTGKHTVIMYFEDPILRATLRDTFRESRVEVAEINDFTTLKRELGNTDKSPPVIVDFEGFRNYRMIMNGSKRICVIVPKSCASEKNIVRLKQYKVFYFCSPIDPKAVAAFVENVL